VRVTLFPISDGRQSLIDMLKHFINFFCFILLKEKTISASGTCIFNCVYQAIPVFVVVVEEDIP
jgi:hypothetical protein